MLDVHNNVVAVIDRNVAFMGLIVVYVSCGSIPSQWSKSNL